MFTHTGIKRARHSLISDIQYVSGHFDILHDLSGERFVELSFKENSIILFLLSKFFI